MPSTVDVYVDGLRLYSQDVAAGPFEFSNLPLVSGAGEANVVVRDASGQTSVASLPFFTSATLLRPGLTDFSIETGFARRSFGTKSNDYDDAPLASATLRLGMSEATTAEAHAEGGAGLLNAGIGVATKLGHFGVASVAVAGSRHEGETGFLADASLQAEVLGVNIGAILRGTFGDYHDLASATAMDFSGDFDALADPLYRPARRLASLSVGTTIPNGWGSAGLNFTYLESATGKRSAILAASYSVGLRRNASLYANAFHDFAGESGIGVFLGLSMPFGADVTASAVAGYGDGGSQASFEGARPMSAQVDDYGWWMRAEQGQDAPVLSGAVSHRSQYARSQVAVRRIGADPTVEASAEGAISTVGRSVHFSNRIDDSFAVVEVGVPGVEVLYENNIIGVTDRTGRMLVPNLRAYERNRIAIDPKNLPVDVEIASTQETIVPSDRAGLAVDFTVKTNARVALVELLGADGEPIPVGAAGRLDGGEEFIVGYDGQAYLRGLKAKNSLTIIHEGGECRADFDYSPSAGEQVHIAGVRCL